MATYHVNDGETSTGIVLNYDDRMHISSGGTANSTAVNSGGDLYVSSGGTATSVTISAGGRLGGFSWQERRSWSTIENGSAVVADHVLIVGNSMTVSEGGTAENTTVNNGGSMLISEGGTAENTTVNNGGALTVSNGGTANGTTLNGSYPVPYSYLHVSSGGTANSTTVNVCGNLTVSNGGTANDTTVNDRGYLYVSSGGTANNTTVNVWGHMYVSSGGTANNTTVNSGGRMHVSEGGTANDTTVKSGGYLTVFNGGTADNTTVKAGGSLTVSGGGTATSVMISAGGRLGGFSWQENRSWSTIENGSAVVADHVLIVGNAMIVSDGGTAENTTVNNGGSMLISEGGTAENTTVNNGGALIVSSGGTASNTTVYGSGLNSGILHISSGGTAENTTVRGYLYVSSGGTANNTFVNNGIMTVSDGGTASNTTVYGDGYSYSSYSGFLYISSGGTANGTTVNSKGNLIVSDGGTANSTTINSFGSMYVSTGGTANSTTVNNGGRMDVYGDGTANSTTVNSGGVLIVSEYGTANNATVNSGGSLDVSNWGTANNITVNWGGRLSVSSDGTASIVFNPWEGTVVSAHEADVTYLGRDANVYYGGTAAGGLISKGDVFSSLAVGTGESAIVYSGGTADSTTVSAGGKLSVSSGGTATNIVENGGFVDVAEGADVTFTANTFSGLVLSNGSATVHSGTTANSTTVRSGGVLNVYNGGLTNSTTVNQHGSMLISEGGTADSTTVNSLGNLTVLDGGTANSTTVNRSGNLTVSEGGTANSTTVNSLGNLTVLDGGTANSTTVNSHGNLTVSEGGTADSTTVNSLGNLTVLDGGTANSTTVNSHGKLYVSEGGTAGNTTVNYRGSMVVSSGGEATNIVENGGYVDVAEGANVTFTANTFSGLVLSNGSATVHSGTTANSTTVRSDGVLNVYNGGLTNSTTVNALGHLHVSEGGTAENTTVNDGYLYVFRGGTANSTTVSQNGMLFVSSGGTANNITLNNYGVLFVSSGGTANSTTVNQDGMLVVSGGGTATSIVENGGGVYVEDGASVTFTANSFSELTISGVYTVTIHSGTTANSTTINTGSMVVFSGGTANSTTVSSGGNLIVSSGGTASLVFDPWRGTVSSEGGAVVTYLERDANIYYGDTADGLLSKGNVFSGLSVAGGASAIVYSGGTADSTTVNYRGNLTVLDGGTANSTTVNSNGNLTVSEGGTAGNTTVNNYGRLYVSSGGTADNTTVYANGSLTVLDGGTANNTTVNGSLTVSSGGTASLVFNPWQGAVTSYAGAVVTYLERDANVYYGANAFGVISKGNVFSGLAVAGKSAIVYSGGTANNTTVNNGSMFVLSGGTANSNTVNSLGRLHVSGGGTADSTTVNYLGSMFVSSGGTADNTTVNSLGSMTVNGGTANSTTVSSGGSMTVSGGTVNSTTVNFSGNLYVSGGGTARDVTINDFGSVCVYSGGRITGSLNNNGAAVSAFGGAEINFDLTSRTTSDAALVSHISLIQGMPDYTITVSATQSTGAYTLAGGAYGFNGTFSLGTAESQYGTITVNGEAFTHEDRTYLLQTSGGKLILNITDGEFRLPSVISTAASTVQLTNQDVTVSAVFSGNTTTGEYSLDNQTWQTYTSGVVMRQNGTVYFRASNTIGYSQVICHDVTNIDKTAPNAPVAAADNIFATNQNVTVMATFSNDSVQREYSLDNQNWHAYNISGVVMEANGTVYFRGTDTAGNASEVTSYEVTNIDKTAPTKPTVKASTTAATNQNVMLTATFSADSVKKQYSLDKKTWDTYVSPVAAAANGTYYFRGIDAVGNISTVTAYKVTNIDKTAPSKPTATASTTAVTNKNVTVTATFSADSVTKQYSLDGESWSNYTTGVVMTANGMVYFRGIDAVGNISKAGYLKVSNIDKSAPSKPTATASTTAATNKNVTVTATFSADSVQKQYSLDNSTWKSCTKGVVMSANGTVYFRGIDAAGNISKVTSYKVSNIDKVAPTKPTVKASTTAATNKNITLTATFSDDSVKKQYSTDNSTWKNFSSVVEVAANGTFYFRSIDAAGNISEVATYEVTNIDKVAPATPTVKASTTAVTNKNVTVTAAFGDDAVKKQYSLDNSTWKSYKTGVTLKANGTVFFRGIDAAGNISKVGYLKVTNIDKTAPVKPKVTASTTAPTNKDVTLTVKFSSDSAKKQYSLDNSTWKSYTEEITVEANATYYFRGIDKAGNISEVTTYEVSNIDKKAPSKPKIASISTTEMTNGSVTVKVKFSSDSSKKQYSLDNKTWNSYKSAGVTLKANRTLYFRSIDAAGNISKVLTQKITNICPKGDFTNDTLEAAGAKEALQLSSAKKITGWVGQGDAQDFIKLEVLKKGQVSLDMNATTAAAQNGGEIKLSLLDKNGKAQTLAAVDGDTLKSKAKLAAGIYYLGVSCADVKKYSTSYNVKAGMLAS